MNRAEAIIDLNAIRSNIKHLMAKTGKPALAVVKADAYGHGLVPVAKAALEGGASWLGVALLEEAIALRNAGISAPTLAWLTPVTDDFELALRKNIDLAVPSINHLNAIVLAAKATGKKARIHLEVDTGMSRGGALSEWRSLAHAAADSQRSGAVEVIGLWSHFARADEPGHPFNEEQIRSFEERISEANGFGLSPELIHLSNSAAALTNTDAHYDMVRLGIAMYGLSPDVLQMGNSEQLGLIPALSLRARVHLVKEVPAGSQVGYGGTAITKTDTKLAVIAIGYADGVPRSANSVAGVLIGNKLSPIVGRVSMDQFVVDVGFDSQASSGDWAYLIGREKSDSYTSEACYTADSWAAASGTINYEIVTRLGPRVTRSYID